MGIKTSEEKKEHACLLFMKGTTQKEIAEKVGVSKQTINKWVADGKWSERRAALHVTRPEIVNNLLRAIDREVQHLLALADTDPSEVAASCDKLSKIAATIEKLDKRASVVDAIEVFMDFGKWLQVRASYDDELADEIVKAINTYQDLYISEQLSTKAK